MDGQIPSLYNKFLVPACFGEDKNPMAPRPTFCHSPCKTAAFQNGIVTPKDEGLCHPSSCSHLNFCHPHQQLIALQTLTNSGSPLLEVSPVFQQLQAQLSVPLRLICLCVLKQAGPSLLKSSGASEKDMPHEKDTAA